MPEKDEKDEPKLRIVVDNTASGRVEVGEAADVARELLGEVGKKATLGAIEEGIGKNLEERGQQLLDTVAFILEKFRPQYSGDIVVEKINQLFFLFGKMAYTKQPNLAWYVLGEDEFQTIEKDGERGEPTKLQFARLYDAISTFENELLPDSSSESKDMPAKYRSEAWGGVDTRKEIEKGFKIIRIVLAQDLPAIYQMPPRRLIREIKALLISQGMGIALPGKDADQVAIKRFEQDVKKRVEDGWSSWRLEGDAKV